MTTHMTTNVTTQVTGNVTANEPMIRLERFEKRYGKVQAVQPLDLSVASGETLALLGPNGGGKSTIIRALVGLHVPSGGKLFVNGIDIVRHPDRVKRQLSYMPQRVTMPGLLTAYEVLTLYAKLKGAAESRVAEVLELFALAEDADRYLREYSGGMLQRLGLAVAFLKEVPLYVLDEPFLNLDPLGSERLRQLLQSMKGNGTTIVFSSHILQNALHLADRVAVLVEGKLVKEETVSDFRAAVTLATTVRVILGTTNEAMIAAAQNAGAHQPQRNGTQVTFRAAPERCLAVIRALEDAGGTVKAFHTEDPDWEALARRHFHGEQEQS